MTNNEVPDEEVSPELLAEVLGKGITIDDLKRMQEALNDTMRSRCDSGEEHQYHLDQMKSYMKSQTVWESRKEDLSPQIPKEPAPIFSSCARYLSVPPMTLLNQGLFYLKNENSESRKYVLSLQKVHAFSFLENDLEELNTRWLIKRDDLEEVYSEHRIVDIIRVQSDQGHGQEYMTEIMVKRANGEYAYFTESDYKYLYKNDIKDMYQERVMTIDEIPKFCDATLKRVLEKVKKITLDVKHGYADPYLSDDDAENIRFYEEYIEERLRHRDQMRQWESYVNGRPLRRRWDLQE
ncbi:hypothetical protein Tco_0664680 [Tanacetum coccineum]